MQNPNEDTEWNDVLRSKGILPPKEKEITLTEDQIVDLVEQAAQKEQGKSLGDMTVDELDELEDDEDEEILLEYRKKRLAEIKQELAKAQFGDVREISGEDYVTQVNKAGEGIWVVLHLFKQGIPLCALINQHLHHLSSKFRATKFLKSIASTCVPGFPDSNLPALFIYYEGQLIKQLIGPQVLRGPNLTMDELEWILAQVGAVKSDLDSDPRPKVRDVMFTSLGAVNNSNKLDDDDLSDENDW